ncbi:cobalamin-binding protein [Chryseobacterium carnipullorum]|uniref:Fused isobutyryl-CoA mutase n=1 Tax=Chryseobacterium carnipullorum TaxID=1124835 RepID=A0A1M7AZG8_CHRCU|nr:methylmalonyl-CoA mutase family protein [Chryseobacterium carnipullorum]AZA48259.1 cobalamin-binding protein [Chryseobacterium carnipullorum]AZA67561.1 cobalamin-binding protein [Chryseobacterium carnipullorum]SHL47809.1 methylmalonyl-CoA mutase [Chryseobacterium carnipullorum]STC91574.1 Methylmalonyl-CoA mutase [Chryseobacterium carnipullorum]
METQKYTPINKVRIVTAASLFDGHDAAINIMRRVIQGTGCEVIHLGHDKSAEEVVNTAIQEDANAIALTSYQGGHNEYFKYIYDLLREKNSPQIKIFGGGGGVILPEEIEDIMSYGIDRIYSPDDGRELGLQGMIDDLVKRSDFATGKDVTAEDLDSIDFENSTSIAKIISAVENFSDEKPELVKAIDEKSKDLNIPIIGITGTGGAGKSSLTDELVRRFLRSNTDKKIAIISIDPSKKKTGGALLGDRIRMNAINDPRVYMRSMATRENNVSVSPFIHSALNVLKLAHPDVIILETSGIGQSGSEVSDFADVSMYVMTPEYGASTQLEKIDMLDYADLVALNKSDKRGALDALQAVKKQFQRNHLLWESPLDDMPVYATKASQFNDHGTTELFNRLIEKVNEKFSALNLQGFVEQEVTDEVTIIPPKRVRYLSEIVENNRQYDANVEKQAELARKMYHIEGVKSFLSNETLDAEYQKAEKDLQQENIDFLKTWDDTKEAFKAEFYSYFVRGKEIKVETSTESLSHLRIPKISLPKYTDWGDLIKWKGQENLPGGFPYTAGIYPFKRTGEDPTRMFAGEGGPERTNRRFHYVSAEMDAKRLSTAFDSVTLYGQDPALPPDIYGKIGNAGVSIATLDDAKKLYSGFDLVNAMTSVSMTINGPAPMLLAFFMNAAIDQNVEKYIAENKLEAKVEAVLKAKFDDRGLERPKYNGELPPSNNGLGLKLLGITGDEVIPAEAYAEIKAKTIATVRGTVQADILKEDQAQNTCIFSTEFALRLMGDVQEFFITEKVRNFYSVSISGYHIAEAGANPVSQLAFTLANGFTYVEYYLSRGMDINDFAPNLSFFFSNGIDPEYSVIGRVARRIWAKAMKIKYGADERSQMLKYHIQTSGRSLHAQEIDFNDIRTTLQALYAIYDNCNSLHTNAYDEAITTPTEQSVRRAMAIQLIINKELGLAKNENPLQGSFIIEELTDLVEEAVYTEFDRITERGGVLGAMETMYQRSKIQEESMHYEWLKHTGEYPIIGVNTFLGKDGSPTVRPGEVIRSTEEEKQVQIETLHNFQKSNEDKSEEALRKLQYAAINQQNLFAVMMDAVKYCSLGQITNALFEVGGKYRRNM